MSTKKDYSKLEKNDLLKVIEKLESRKKYGLIWDEEKTKEQFEKESENALPVLKEVKGREIKTDPTKPSNILIEGDNYHALSVLNYTHQGKIDVIYIDPPYNTGNKDFVFNDCYVDLDDTYRHSKWLSFMNKRLRLAHGLLKTEGVIFMSIGEAEVANLKLLSDEIFGENNFMSYVARVAKTASNKGNYFAPSIDFILVYAKNISSLSLFKDEVNVNLYKKKDKKGFYRDDVALYQSALDIRPNQRYFIECPDGSLVIPPGNVFPKAKKDAAFIKPETSADKVWRWSYPTYLEKKDLLVFKATKRSPLLNQNGKPAKWNIYTKSYLDERSEVGVAPRNFLDQFINRKGADFLKTIDIDFDYSKPVELIKHLIRITDKSSDIIVLDFMAGSGTTGQAVLEMNKNDNGGRSFVLCTNNELNGVGGDLAIRNPKANKEELGLCRRVTVPRLERVMKGYKDFKPLGGNLKYFKTSFVKNSISKDDLKIRITRECTEMLCLREGIFEEVKKKSDYRIFEQNDRVLAVYYALERDGLEQLKKELDKIKGEKILYCFTLDPLGLDKKDFVGWENVSLEPIPQKILDIYGQIYEY